ncbi:hypothetical protein THAOC_33170 [Thalassiosira oceanica]|uniref:Uncharacterized protein n=1 Tax=Thalassiosira oceanica TaxID=159749 RepID=K0R7M8_THAOC|nr:hypothetical protein THAOC_33170 [Thalassiosira oceanica]|eukprot:EJK48064.1 hypothetical protein THAOC_33170 [Thalassiosira oceanica]
MDLWSCEDSSSNEMEPVLEKDLAMISPINPAIKQMEQMLQHCSHHLKYDNNEIVTDATEIHGILTGVACSQLSAMKREERKECAQTLCNLL